MRAGAAALWLSWRLGLRLGLGLGLRLGLRPQRDGGGGRTFGMGTFHLPAFSFRFCLMLLESTW